METFETLLYLSNKRKISDKQFIKLFLQLFGRQSLEEDEFLKLLENSSNEDYLITASIGSVQILNLFWNSLSKLLINQQIRIIKKYQLKIQSSVPGTFVKGGLHGTSVLRELIRLLISYSDYVLKSEYEDLLNELIFIWDIIISKFDLKNDESVKKFTIKLLGFLGSNNYSKQFNYCKKFIDTNKTNLNVLQQPNLNNLTVSKNSKNFSRFERLKIFYYFNESFRKFSVPPNEVLLKNFTTLFEADCYKLIYSVFDGIYLSIKSGQPQYVKDNWMNFFSSRLPRLIMTFKVESLESTIARVFENFENFESLNSDIKHVFIKTLIFNKILSIKSFHKFFPTETKINQQSLIHEMSNINSLENFNDVLNDKLYDINCEFISIEESNLIEYFDMVNSKIGFSMQKQLDLVESIEKLINLLIDESNFEKLNRLVIILLHNEKLFQLYLFNSTSKYLTIYKIIKLIDSETFKLNENIESSFQEFYSYFGNLLLLIIKFSEYISINFKLKNSFTLNYLFNYRSNYNNLSGTYNEEVDNDKTIVNNYNNLMKEWINSLFDESEGLSDELIKSIDIKQIYQLIPIIYQQAILAFIQGKINLKILNNGLDYLSQNFLLPCNLSIVNWLILKINLKNKNMSSFMTVLDEMVKQINKVKLESNNELKLSSDIILRSVVDKCSEAFNKLDITSSMVTNSSIMSRMNETSRRVTNFPKFDFEEFETNIFKAFGGQDANFELIDNYIRSNDTLIKDFLVSLNSSTVKNNSKENLKYLIDFIIFLNINKTVVNDSIKQYWVNKFKTLNYDDRKYSLKGKFEINMDHHYSSIFNIENDGEDETGENFNDSFNNSVGMSKDGNVKMERGDDGLFESITIEYCLNEMNKYNRDFSEFFTMVIKFKNTNLEDLLFKYIQMIYAKLQTDLEEFQV